MSTSHPSLKNSADSPTSTRAWASNRRESRPPSCGTAITTISARVWAWRGTSVLRAGGNLIYVNPGLWNQVFQQNTKDPTTGLNGNATGYTTCTDVVSNAAFCTPGIGNIVSSGIVLTRAPLVLPDGLGVTPCPSSLPAAILRTCLPGGPGAGNVNWNQVP